MSNIINAKEYIEESIILEKALKETYSKSKKYFGLDGNIKITGEDYEGFSFETKYNKFYVRLWKKEDVRYNRYTVLWELYKIDDVVYGEISISIGRSVVYTGHDKSTKEM